jgi:hypothetical protein
LNMGFPPVIGPILAASGGDVECEVDTMDTATRGEFLDILNHITHIPCIPDFAELSTRGQTRKGNETMAEPLPTASSSEVSKRFGYFYDEAMIHPVGVERNGATRVVLLSMPEYQRLALLDHVVTTCSEMSDEAFKAIRDAKAPAESIALNHLMDETGTD